MKATTTTKSKNIHSFWCVVFLFEFVCGFFRSSFTGSFKRSSEAVKCTHRPRVFVTFLCRLFIAFIAPENSKVFFHLFVCCVISISIQTLTKWRAADFTTRFFFSREWKCVIQNTHSKTGENCHWIFTFMHQKNVALYLNHDHCINGRRIKCRVKVI